MGLFGVDRLAAYRFQRSVRGDRLADLPHHHHLEVRFVEQNDGRAKIPLAIGEIGTRGVGDRHELGERIVEVLFQLQAGRDVNRAGDGERIGLDNDVVVILLDHHRNLIGAALPPGAGFDRQHQDDRRAPDLDKLHLDRRDSIRFIKVPRAQPAACRVRSGARRPLNICHTPPIAVRLLL